MKLIRSQWNDPAADSLAAAMGEDAAFIKDEVERGIAILWNCIGCGWVVTRQEGQELVFVAGSGKNAREVIKLFMKNRKQLNFNTCRIHSARKGMGKYLSSLGFEEVERVYRVAV